MSVNAVARPADLAKRPRSSVPLVTIIRMRIRDQLEREARRVASWLEARAEAYPPLRIVRVDSAVGTDDDGEAVIKLTVVLEDPAEPDGGWSTDALFRLIGEVNDEAEAAEHGMFVYVFPQAVSTAAA